MGRTTIIEVLMRSQFTSPFFILEKRVYAEQKKLRALLLPVFKTQKPQQEKIYLRAVREEANFFLS